MIEYNYIFPEVEKFINDINGISKEIKDINIFIDNLCSQTIGGSANYNYTYSFTYKGKKYEKVFNDYPVFFRDFSTKNIIDFTLKAVLEADLETKGIKEKKTKI